jgi:hypothetical protein
MPSKTHGKFGIEYWPTSTTKVQEPPQMTFSHNRKIAWVRELIQDGEKYGVPEGTTRQVKRPKPFSSYTALMCNLLDE